MLSRTSPSRTTTATSTSHRSSSKAAGPPRSVAVSRDRAAHRRPDRLPLLQFTSGLGNDWFFGASYVDLMDPDTTDEFITSTHEPYRQLSATTSARPFPASSPTSRAYRPPHVGPGLLRPLDDPPAEDGSAPAAATTSSRTSLSLFLPVGDYRKRRYDYWRTVTELFVRTT